MQLELFAPTPAQTTRASLRLARSGSEYLDEPDLQLDLFDARYYLLRRAWLRLGEWDMGAARADVADFRLIVRSDAAGEAEARRIVSLCDRLEEASRRRSERRAAVLLAIAREVQERDAARGRDTDALRRQLLRRAAHAHREARSDEALLEGRPAGYYLLEAGALAEAETSLSAALHERRRARTLFLLGDVASARGDREGARARYLEALLVNPWDAAYRGIRDAEVLALPDAIRFELELSVDPLAWAAPVGAVLDVLPLYALFPEEGLAEANSRERPTSRSQCTALAQAWAFMRALTVASSRYRFEPREILEARREMKRLCPALFERYLARV